MLSRLTRRQGVVVVVVVVVVAGAGTGVEGQSSPYTSQVMSE